MIRKPSARVIIVDATDAEVAVAASLWHAGWHDAHGGIVPEVLLELRTLESFSERTRRHLSDTRLARRGSEVVGICIVKGDELYQFYVAASARGKGVAQALIDDAERRMRATGYRRAWLGCAVGNERAIRFYRKVGWSSVGTVVIELETAEGSFPFEVWRFEKQL